MTHRQLADLNRLIKLNLGLILKLELTDKQMQPIVEAVQDVVWRVMK